MKYLLFVFFTFVFSYSGISQQFFKSNSIGMPLEEINESDTPLYTYYVKVYTLEYDSDLSEKKKILYKNDLEHGEWTKMYRGTAIVQESIEINGKKEIFDFEDGRIILWSALTDGILNEKWKLSYSDSGQLLKRIRTYPEESPAVIIYNTEEDGALRSQVREHSGINDYVVQGIDRQRYLQWIGSTETGTFESYKDGRIQREKTIHSDSMETWNYTYENNYYTKRKVDDNVQYKEVYNYENNLLTSIVTKDDERLYYESRNYDNSADNRIISKTIIDNNTRYDWEYTYSGNELVKEVELRNTKINSVITYSEKGYTKEVYVDGDMEYSLQYDENGILLFTDIVEGSVQ